MSVKSTLLGLAFAAADLLLELAPDGRILFAAGSLPLPGSNVESWVGTSLSRHLDEETFDLVMATAGALGGGRRSAPLDVWLPCGAGDARRASIRLFLVPELSPRISCALAYEGDVFVSPDAPRPPLLTADSLLTRARAELETQLAGDMVLAFVDVPGLEDVRATGPAGAAAAERVESVLLDASIGKSSAGRIALDRYALLRDDNDGRAFAGEVRQALRAEGLDIAVSTSEARIKPSADPHAALRALRLAIDRCLRQDAPVPTDRDVQRAVERTLREAEAFRAMVKARAFELFYQPVVDLRTGAPRHFEALSRFSGTDGPGASIHLAEELRITTDFDLAVAEKAIQELRRPGAGLVKIAVNLSAASLHDDSFVERLTRMTANAPAERHRMMVELTESAAVSDLEATRRRLSMLRCAGIKVCIDDFGTGGASYDYLRVLPVDVVKIDGRFITNLDSDLRSRTLVGHMVELCQSLGLATVAEMIETESVAEVARDLGVDFGQGWFFGRPEAHPRTAPAGRPVHRRQGPMTAWG